MAKSRKRKATQPEAGTRDMSRDSERHDDAGSGLQVRQSWDGSRVQLRSSYKQAVATQPSGYSGKHNSTDARFDMDGKVSDYVVSDQQGNVTSRNGRKVSYFFYQYTRMSSYFSSATTIRGLRYSDRHYHRSKKKCTGADLWLRPFFKRQKCK